MQVGARQSDANAQDIEQHAHPHDLQHTKALDQVAGHKAGGKHANHMPLQHPGRVFKRQATDLHGQRRGGHQ